jgi:hypothetical protein
MYKDISWNGSSFWHGTSTIFLNSIRETGLGAINPSTDLKLLNVLKFLYTQVRMQNIFHPVLEINRASIEAAIAQSDMDHQGMSLNYRHEGIYIAASPIRAAYYACLNKVGSEILEKCLILLSILIDAKKEPEIPSELNAFGIRQYLSISAKPIMIEITNVADENLVLENGNDASETLKELREIFPHLPIAQQFEKLQFCNFRLLKPVPTAMLRFYEVDFEGHPKSRNFQYYLSRIH